MFSCSCFSSASSVSSVVRIVLGVEMEKPYILHLFTPMAQASPFDINMAYDAGYDGVVPYTHVEPEQVAGLTQDTIFSRGPKGAKRTGIFIGGRDNGLAADMLDAAREAMVPPFEVSVFADPSGAFTTAAAVLASQAGAKVGIVGREESSRARLTAEDCNRRYGTHVEPVDANTDALKLAMMLQADVVLATARAGHRVVTKELLAAAPRLLAAADVNAVPPSGIEGVGPMDDGAPLAAGSRKAVGIGALTVGNIKYQTQRGLLETMLKAEKPVYLDMRDAFTEARKHAGVA